MGIEAGTSRSTRHLARVETKKRASRGSSADSPPQTFEDYARSLARTPLEKAQQLIYDAWDARSLADCIAFARAALAVSGDCADASLVPGWTLTPGAVAWVRSQLLA